MKRSILSALALTLMLGLAACQADQNQQKPTTTAPASQTVNVVDAKAELMKAPLQGRWVGGIYNGPADFAITSIEGSALAGTMRDHGTRDGTRTHRLVGTVDGNKLTVNQGSFSWTATLTRENGRLRLRGDYKFGTTNGSYDLKTS